MQLFSHPDKLLKDHLLNVYKLGVKKFESKTLNFDDIEIIKLVTKIVLISHDFGKANKYFQRKLELKINGDIDCDEYKELTKQGKNNSNHSLISALFTYYITYELTKDDLFSLIGMIVVSRHHGDLKNFNDMITVSKNDWEILEKQFLTIDLTVLQEIIELIDLDIDIRTINFLQLKDSLSGYKYNKKIRKIKKILTNETNYLILNFIYSILISSDKAEAIFYNRNLSYKKLEELVLNRTRLNTKAVDEYRKLKGWDNPNNEMNKKRNSIYKEVLENVDKINLENERILSINVPTGTGKTLASLSVGLNLREKLGRDYRIIYALPFTSIIDQNYEVFTKVFSETGQKVDSSLMIKHHYLTPKSYIKEERYEDEEYDVSKHLIESWNSEIIVTTFVQLLHSIFSNKNKSLIKFYNIANSIILLDEVQSIPYNYWELVKVMMNELAEKLNCYFVFITATMPLIYSEEKREIKELAISKREHFEYFDRIRLDLSYLKQEMILEDFKEFIQSELEEYRDKNFLIILNTIKSSIEIYNYIKDLIDDEYIEGEVMYLSTNIIPKERGKRIDKIGNANQRQIIVSTQMVEAGVDIDLDRVYRDLAPLDSINQTCGRCNRNFDPRKKGVVTLVKLVNENHKMKSYAGYVYEDTLINTTAKILEKLPEIVEEKDFFKMNNQYFKCINEVMSNDDSIQLLEKLQKLRYEQAFWKDDDSNGHIFQLIKQDFDTANLFIELDEQAKEVWAEYERINRIEINTPEDYNIRSGEFENIKKEFLGYVITVPKKVAKKQLSDEQTEGIFNYISNAQVDSVYDRETGFKRTNDEVESFF